MYIVLHAVTYLHKHISKKTLGKNDPSYAIFSDMSLSNNYI